MNISKYEQRVLHALAQGGCIRHRRCESSGRIIEAHCFTRDGYRLADCTMAIFRRLKRRGLIASQNGQPGVPNSVVQQGLHFMGQSYGGVFLVSSVLVGLCLIPALFVRRKPADHAIDPAAAMAA